MQRIYNYIPETNRVSMVYIVAAILGYNCGTCNVNLRERRVVLSHQYSPKRIIIVILNSNLAGSQNSKGSH